MDLACAWHGACLDWGQEANMSETRDVSHACDACHCGREWMRNRENVCCGCGRWWQHCECPALVPLPVQIARTRALMGAHAAEVNSPIGEAPEDFERAR